MGFSYDFHDLSSQNLGPPNFSDLRLMGPNSDLDPFGFKKKVQIETKRTWYLRLVSI